MKAKLMAETYATKEQLNNLRDTLDRRLSELTKRQDEHHKTLFGNGVPGWDEMLRTLYADYLERKEAEKQQRKDEANADKQTKLQKVIGSWQFQIALLNGVLLVAIEIVKGLF